MEEGCIWFRVSVTRYGEEGGAKSRDGGMVQFDGKMWLVFIEGREWVSATSLLVI